MRLSDECMQTADTVEATPDERVRALAFVHSVAHVGFVITPSIEEEVEPFAIQLPWAFRKYGRDVVRDPSVGGWRVVRRE